MLVTDTSWAESHPVRRAFVRPYQPWRCIGWTDETLNFLIITTRNACPDAHLPDGWLVGGPEALVEVASQLDAGSFSVHVIDRSRNGGVNFGQVTGIWREREQIGDVPSFWFAIGGSEPEPCSRFRQSEALPELVSALIIGNDVVDATANP